MSHSASPCGRKAASAELRVVMSVQEPQCGDPKSLALKNNFFAAFMTLPYTLCSRKADFYLMDIYWDVTHTIRGGRGLWGTGLLAGEGLWHDHYFTTTTHVSNSKFTVDHIKRYLKTRSVEQMLSACSRQSIRKVLYVWHITVPNVPVS